MPSTLKILMLHGYTQSGPLFYSKTRALEKYLKKLASPSINLAFEYPSAPHRIELSEIPDVDATLINDADEVEMFGWWRRDAASGEWRGLRETWEFLGGYLEEKGPFIGAIGFSQGAGLAALLASMLEPTRPKPSNTSLNYIKTSHPPLKFVVAYSGFKSPLEEHRWIYEPKIKTPILNVLGSLDTVVSEARSRELVEACEVERVVWHPGGHYVIVKRQWLEAVGKFTIDCLTDRMADGEGEKKKNKEEEESVEDMEVPF